jgi:hypothetical protein
MLARPCYRFGMSSNCDDLDAVVPGWLHARSVARGLPLPVPDHGGWRVDTGSPHELRRHVFSRPCEGVRELAAGIDVPCVFLKLAGSPDALRALLTPRWELDKVGWLMGCETFAPPSRPLPPGYRLHVTRQSGVTAVRIEAGDGSLAASGYAAEADGYFVYDRIVTAPTHGRRGLGSHVMAALREARQSPSSRQVLVATDAGRALYTALGWHVVSPFATAHVPAPER